MGEFPAVLEDAFDEIDLARLSSPLAVIDPAGAILWTNAAWHEFADRNGAAGESARWSSYFDPIARPLRGFYERAFAEALRTGEIFEQDYECSSPETRRFYRLRALPVRQRVLLIEHVLVAGEPRPLQAHAPPSETEYRNEHGLLVQCSNCRHTRHPESAAYHWVASWADRSPPRTSHGICPACAGFYWGLADG